MRQRVPFVVLAFAMGVLAAFAQRALAGEASRPGLASEGLTARIFLVRLVLQVPPDVAPNPAHLVARGVPGDAPVDEVMQALQKANPSFRIELMEMVETPLVVGQPVAIKRGGPSGLFVDATIERLRADPDAQFAAKAKAEGRHLVPLHVVYRFRRALPLPGPGPTPSTGAEAGNTINRLGIGQIWQINTVSLPRGGYGEEGRPEATQRWIEVPEPIVAALLALSRRPVAIPPFTAGLPKDKSAAETPYEAYWVRSVNVDFQDTPITDAIKALARDLDRPVLFPRQFPKDLRVTLSLRGADPEHAVRMVCEAAGLTCKIDRASVVITAPPTVNVGGAQVPLLGAMSVSSGLPGIYMPGASRSVLRVLQTAEGHASFAGDDKLVDLEVKDAPIRETMAKLSEVSSIKIVVHEAVPKEIKITAKMYRMPLGEVLSLIVGQANLTYTVALAPGADAKQRYESGLITRQEYLERQDVATVHIVPKPELKVSGPGVGRDTAVRTLRWPPGASEQELLTWAVEPPQVRCSTCGFYCPAESHWKYCPRCGAKLGQGAKQPAKGK